MQLDPFYADSWAHLAYLYQEEYHHNRNLLPESLDRALEAASRAVELDPDNTMGLMALAMTLFSRGSLDAAQSQMERALLSNPTDTTILAGFAVNSVFAGDIERGLELGRVVGGVVLLGAAGVGDAAGDGNLIELGLR